MSFFVLENTSSAEMCADFPMGSLSPVYIATVLHRLQVVQRVAAVKKEIRRERRKRLYRYCASFWPVALGVVLSAYAPVLHDLAAGYAPWAATLLFPLSVVVQQREVHLSLGMAQALSAVMLYVQLPLDGWLARRLLRPRPAVWSVCGQVTCFHALAVLYIGLVTGSLTQIMAN